MRMEVFESRRREVHDLRYFIFLLLFTLALSKSYQTGIWTFFGLTTCLTKSLEPIGILVPIKFKFISDSGTFSLEATNASGKTEVLGLKLTGPVFISKGK